MTAGRGWVALALVVFATWAPRRVAVGAYLFGTVWIMGLYAQGVGLGIPPQLLASLPYLVTIAALILISGNRALTKVNTPACIGRPSCRIGDAGGVPAGAGAMTTHHMNERRLRRHRPAGVVDVAGEHRLQGRETRSSGHADAGSSCILSDCAAEPRAWTAPEVSPGRIPD